MNRFSNIIVSLLSGLEIDVKKFFIYYLTLALTSLCGASIAFAFSALVSVFAVANLLVALVFIVYMVRKEPGLIVTGASNTLASRW